MEALRSLRSLIEASAGFGVGASLAFTGHMFVLNARPSDLKLPGPTEYEVFILLAALIICATLFLLGSIALRSFNRASLVRASAVIAIPYGILVYVLAFFVLFTVYHLAEAPSPMLSTVTLAVVVFLSGVLFVALFSRKYESAS